MKKSIRAREKTKRSLFSETAWTKSSKNIGEYIFRRLSLDQSDKELSYIRPRHYLSKLIVTSKEIESYVTDYLAILAEKNINSNEDITDDYL